MGEYIFLNTDPSFEIAARVVPEVHRNSRLSVTNSQNATITRVKGNRDDPLDLGSPYHFSRRVSACARLCMAAATGMDPSLWDQNVRLFERNYRDQTNFSMAVDKGNTFKLVDGLPNQQLQQRRYGSEYDRLYPHFTIEQQIRGLQPKHSVNIPAMMYIFRDNFREIIQINTTMGISLSAEGQYICRINVVCIRAEISSGVDGYYLSLLKALCNVPPPDDEILSTGFQRMDINAINDSKNDYLDRFVRSFNKQ